MNKGDIGIDISTHNGDLDFSQLKGKIKFAFVRGGYGTAVDARAAKNIKGCIENGIPVGVYWFSYALSENSALDEAMTCVKFMSDFNITLPVAFDYEEESLNYALNHGVSITADKMVAMATRFLDVVKAYGYTPMLYTNKDFLNRGFNKLVGKYKIWCAAWTNEPPKVDCEYWQFTSSLKISGINCTFDGNKYMGGTQEMKAPTLQEFLQGVYNEYLQVAKDIYADKYGKGAERKKKLAELGYDYQMAQVMVNLMKK